MKKLSASKMNVIYTKTNKIWKQRIGHDLYWKKKEYTTRAVKQKKEKRPFLESVGTFPAKIRSSLDLMRESILLFQIFK